MRTNQQSSHHDYGAVVISLVTGGDSLGLRDYISLKNRLLIVIKYNNDNNNF